MISCKARERHNVSHIRPARKTKSKSLQDLRSILPISDLVAEAEEIRRRHPAGQIRIRISINQETEERRERTFSIKNKGSGVDSMSPPRLAIPFALALRKWRTRPWEHRS